MLKATFKKEDVEDTTTQKGTYIARPLWTLDFWDFLDTFFTQIASVGCVETRFANEITKIFKWEYLEDHPI